MQYYNSTKRIASYGFGAKVNYFHETSNCFALTGDIFQPEVNGVQELIEAYKQAVNKVEASGPTSYAETIEAVMNRAEGS